MIVERGGVINDHKISLIHTGIDVAFSLSNLAIHPVLVPTQQGLTSGLEKGVSFWCKPYFQNNSLNVVGMHAMALQGIRSFWSSGKSCRYLLSRGSSLGEGRRGPKCLAGDGGLGPLCWAENNEQKRVITDRVLVVWERRMLRGYCIWNTTVIFVRLNYIPIHTMVCRLQWPLTTVEVNQESLHKIRFSQINQSLNKASNQSINKPIQTQSRMSIDAEVEVLKPVFCAVVLSFNFIWRKINTNKMMLICQLI